MVEGTRSTSPTTRDRAVIKCCCPRHTQHALLSAAHPRSNRPRQPVTPRTVLTVLLKHCPMRAAYLEGTLISDRSPMDAQMVSSEGGEGQRASGSSQ